MMLQGICSVIFFLKNNNRLIETDRNFKITMVTEIMQEIDEQIYSLSYEEQITVLKEIADEVYSRIEAAKSDLEAIETYEG